jgi:hypothetical protein
LLRWREFNIKSASGKRIFVVSHAPGTATMYQEGVVGLQGATLGFSEEFSLLFFAM